MQDTKKTLKIYEGAFYPAKYNVGLGHHRACGGQHQPTQQRQIPLLTPSPWCQHRRLQRDGAPDGDHSDDYRGADAPVPQARKA